MIFFPFIFSNKFYMFVDLYYKLILINKFIKHNKVNDLFFLLDNGFFSCYRDHTHTHNIN
jgi:hypothetical protein